MLTWEVIYVEKGIISQEEGNDVYVAIEVSYKIGDYDIERVISQIRLKLIRWL